MANPSYRAVALLPFVTVVIGACATLPQGPQTLELTQEEARGYDYARAHCAPCHAITANAASPNPEAPTFESIANSTGLTERTLGSFLRDSHNFPGAMNFTIDSKNVKDTTTYMLTLRRPDYKPAI